MSLFTDASLVMVPSGYKTSKVYSVKPTDGSGDLTFTRSNDTATRVGPDGLIEKVRTNLLTYSNTFSEGAWIKANATLTGGQADPNGGTSATRVQYSGAGASYIYQNKTSTNATASVYARAYSGTAYLRICDPNGSFATGYNLTESWQRISTSGASMVGVSFDTYDGGWTAQDVVISFAQFETGDIATPYIATTTAAVSVGPVSGLPRLDYSGGASCPRLLLEPQRTNVCLWSEQMDNAGWSKINAPTITTNIATAPDGYGGADGIQDTTGGTYKRVRQSFSVAANGTHTASVFVKKETSETNYGGLALVFTNRFVYGIIDAVNGTLTVSSDSYIASSSTKVEDYGTYWRFSLTATDDQSNTSLDITYYATLSTNGTSTGVGAGSVRTIWGFQLEVGASYATSYIPTLGAAVTRGADAANNLAASSLIGTTEGVIFLDINTPSAIELDMNLSIGDGSTSDYARIEIRQNLNIQIRYRIGGSNQISVNAGSYTAGDRLKIAFAYKSGDSALYMNGTQLTTSSATLTANSFDEFKYSFPNGTVAIEGRVNQTLLFQTRLSNADLATLTTI